MSVVYYDSDCSGQQRRRTKLLPGEKQVLGPRKEKSVNTAQRSNGPGRQDKAGRAGRAGRAGEAGEARAGVPWASSEAPGLCRHRHPRHPRAESRTAWPAVGNAIVTAIRRGNYSGHAVPIGSADAGMDQETACAGVPGTPETARRRDPARPCPGLLRTPGLGFSGLTRQGCFTTTQL